MVEGRVKKSFFFLSQTHVDVAKMREEVCLLELGVNLQQHLMYTLVMPPPTQKKMGELTKPHKRALACPFVITPSSPSEPAPPSLAPLDDFSSVSPGERRVLHYRSL